MSGAPELPREMSANGAEVWDWAARFSEHVHREDAKGKLRALIGRPLRCGDCFWWMKSRDCPREHNVHGQTRGPSGDDLTCGKYQETASATELRNSRRAELAALEDQS